MVQSRMIQVYRTIECTGDIAGQAGRRKADVARSLQRIAPYLLPAGIPTAIRQRMLVEPQACRGSTRILEKILEPPEALHETRFYDIVPNFLDLISEDICKDF